MSTLLRCKIQPLRIASALGLALIAAQSGAQSQISYSIPLHTISAGGASLRNACFRLAGTLAETAPGYSNDGTYTLLAGFSAAASSGSGVDEVFFSGFEGC